MICARCGVENRQGRKFCAQCGAPLQAACPRCGAPNEPGDRFCGECAAPLQPSADAAAPPSRPVPHDAPVAERRVVSVLFADLVGFTTLAEGRDPEEARELLSRYADLARETIGRYGGTVEKFIGDAVMAVWGAPTAREDDAELAVRAGLDLVDAVRRLAPGLEARAAVLTGEAAVSLGATNEGIVAGDLVNTASRLQSIAPPGAVLVGEATHRAASKAVAFEDAGTHALKGRTAPVPAWRALRVVAERGGRNRSETLEAPFVGRNDELRLLKELFHATAREHRARLVSVVGPAGIGKTRLAWEFLKYVDGLLETVWWHDGRSPAYGEGVTFWALGEMVRARCGLLEADDEATTRAKLAATLQEHVADEAERQWLEPALLALLGVERRIAPEQLFAAWRTFFERLAATAPVVMVFEDFHHADPGLIDFVDHLLEWSRPYPIFVLTLSRPELLDKRPDWGAGKRNFTSLYLEPLAESAMRELLGGLVPGLPEGAVRAIVRRSGGIPLYAIETVRMLVAEGRLVLQGDVFVPQGDLTNLAVPESLMALIAARLDGLAPEDRTIVQDAAVLGQSFALAALSAITGMPEPDLAVRLGALVRRELLTREADPRSPERGQYTFVQALIREVAYGTLARRERKARHLAAARYYESLGSNELAGALAGHYLAAYRNAPEGAEADAAAAQARIALRGAADRASALGSHDQAVAFLEQALEATAEAREQAELLERLGEAASLAARHDAAERYLRRAIELDEVAADRTGVIRATRLLGHVLLSGSRAPDALAVLEPAAAEIGEEVRDPVAVALRAELARAYMLADQNARALDEADRALAMAEHADLTQVVAEALVTKGSALGNVGRTIEGLSCLRTGIELAEAGNYVTTMMRGYINRSILEGTRDPRATLDHVRAALAVGRRLGLRHHSVILLENGLSVAARIGEWDWVIRELTSALGEEFDAADRVILLEALAHIGSYQGVDLTSQIDEIEGLVGESDDPGQLMSLAAARAYAAFAAGRYLDAVEGWRRAAALSASNIAELVPMAARSALWAGEPGLAIETLEQLDEAGIRGPVVDADRSIIHAGIAAVEGRRAEALALYREALGVWRSLGMILDEALAGVDIATFVGTDEPDAASAVARAEEILGQLGAAPLLRRLEEVRPAAIAAAPDADRAGAPSVPAS